MKLIAVITSGIFTYLIAWVLVTKRRVEYPEAEPFKFERDKPIENANETFEAWAKLRRQIDIEKREGAI
jgi:hypothetical protein